MFVIESSQLYIFFVPSSQNSGGHIEIAAMMIVMYPIDY